MTDPGVVTEALQAPTLPRVYLVRHGETAWSLTGVK
jgi:hypothetical protein